MEQNNQTLVSSMENNFINPYAWSWESLWLVITFLIGVAQMVFPVFFKYIRAKPKDISEKKKIVLNTLVDISQDENFDLTKPENQAWITTAYCWFQNYAMMQKYDVKKIFLSESSGENQISENERR